MGLWSSLVDSAKTIGSGISSGVNWAWNHVSFTSAIKYTVNTATQILEQGLALPNAISSLIYNPKAREIANSMGNILVNDVQPLIIANTLNNCVQNYFGGREQEQASWYAPYSLFLTGLSFANYAVKAYTWRQGAEAVSHTFALSQTAPAAFNSNKLTAPPSLCSDCNTKRKLKGSGRETLILLTNDALTWGIRFVPYIGEPTAKVLSIYFNGRYITRLATPERCERHKAIKQESALALGLTHELTVMSMDWVLNSTLGLPPRVAHYVLRKMLFLWQVNLAAHMNLPLVQDKSKECFDPLDTYEWALRFVFDVLIDGSMKRIPIDFKPDVETPPIAIVSKILRSLTKTLNKDLDKEMKVLNPGYTKEQDSVLYTLIVPGMFRSSRDFINDPLINKYWPELRQEAISTSEQIIAECQSRKVKVASWAPKVTAYPVEYLYGVARGVTAFLLLLSQEEDFINFASALKSWFERHNIKIVVDLASDPQIAMLGVKKLEPVPDERKNESPIPAKDLLTERTSSGLVSAPMELVPNRSNTALNPYNLFTTRHKQENKTVNLAPQGLFTTRHKVEPSVLDLGVNKSA